LFSRARVTGFALPVLVEGLLSHFRQKATSALRKITTDVILKTYAGDFE
jgi:hypothetical protein